MQSREPIHSWCRQHSGGRNEPGEAGWEKWVGGEKEGLPLVGVGRSPGDQKSCWALLEPLACAEQQEVLRAAQLHAAYLT